MPRPLTSIRGSPCWVVCPPMRGPPSAPCSPAHSTARCVASTPRWSTTPGGGSWWSSPPDRPAAEAGARERASLPRPPGPTNPPAPPPPVLLDETFDQLEPAVVPLLLELLPGLVGDLQVMLLTEDEAIASWARLEALAGELALIEPALAAD